MTFPGLYRGVCVSNADPNGKHRIRVKVPMLFGDHDVGWAMPCVPPGWPAIAVDHSSISGGGHSQGTGSGTHTHNSGDVASVSGFHHYARVPTPKPGTGVWVMFEAGDPDKPVWMGVFDVNGPSGVG